MLIAAAAIIAGFAILIWSADLFIIGAAAIARNMGMSPIIIGMTIVSIGTSAPEVLVSLTAAFSGAGELAVGNAIGSNIANIGLVMGITVVITPMLVLQSAIRKELLLLLAVTAAAGVVLVDNTLSDVEGWLLIGAMVLVMIYLLRSQTRDSTLQLETEEEPLQELSTGRAWLTFAAGLLLLIGSSHLLVWGAVITAQLLGVSELLIGLTVIAIGTSLPELAATVTSARRGHTEIAIGNIVGSNLFNLLVVAAIPGIVSIQTVSPLVFTRDYAAMTLLTILLAAAIYVGGKRRVAPPGYAYLGRTVGVLFATFYALYYYLLYISL
ncbi:MAG: calcium/sodium antiporter [Halieaceae bacterium]|jgi:cation:H+ antiporter|nr:calcium/sodium antiporter [Halieaceae bacterium]